REVAQRAQTALAQHAACTLDHGGEDPIDRAFGAAHGTERKREVAFLGIAAALENQQLILRPRRLAGLEHALEHRRDHVPDLGPNLAARTAERPRVLLAQDLGITVVVEDRTAGTPIDDDRKPGPEAYAERAPQTLRPGFHRPESRTCPVERSTECSHLAPAREKVVGGPGGRAGRALHLRWRRGYICFGVGVDVLHTPALSVQKS